jgi:uroporphyrinogen-III decarboxylase
MTNGPAMSELYEQRLQRYVTALHNGGPDRVPIRPFVAEFTARYAGYTCQQVTHDYKLAFEAARACAREFDWDAVVPNMVYVWTGLTEAIGLRYYGVPGIQVPPDTGFQYLEPPADQAFMRAEEYDHLIADPTGFLLEVWLPRVARDVVAPGGPVTPAHNLSFLRGGMAMLQYFTDFGPQVQALREECGMPCAIAGILKAPLDIIADKLRGYIGLCDDLLERPDKVLAACRALAPHLAHVAVATADPGGQLPVGFWMHRGCVPFISPTHFEQIYWPTLRPVIESIWANGHQTLFYAEGRWGSHLERFAELPAHSIVYHVDQDDIVEVHRVLGARFCISGGIPNHLLSVGTPEQVRTRCREVLDTAAQDGGYVMDASAIIQNDARPENLRALTDFVREYGVYANGGGADALSTALSGDGPATGALTLGGEPAPGVCVPWSEHRATLPDLTGDEGIVRRIWEDVDALAYSYAWQCLLSF